MPTPIKERPIIFSAEMIRAILGDRKSQTRRVVNRIASIGRVTEFGKSEVPGYDWTFRDRRMLWNDLTDSNLMAHCPYGVPGDRLWVRETFWCCEVEDGGIGNRFLVYDADWPAGQREPPADKARPWHCEQPMRWGKHPSTHMSRWASRLTLEVTDVRSEADCEAEGLDNRLTFPWCWCISFRRIGNENVSKLPRLLSK